MARQPCLAHGNPGQPTPLMLTGAGQTEPAIGVHAPSETAQQALQRGGPGLPSARPPRLSPVSEAETALVSMLSVTTLRAHRLKTRPGIKRQKWRTLDIRAWHGAGRGGHGDWGAQGTRAEVSIPEAPQGGVAPGGSGGTKGPRGSNVHWACAEGRGMGLGPRPSSWVPWVGGAALREGLTMATPTAMKMSTLARSRVPSEKWLLNHPMTTP